MKQPFLLLTLISFFIIGCDSNQPASTANNKTEIVMPAPVTTEDQSVDSHDAQDTDSAPTTDTMDTINTPAEAPAQTALSGEQVYKRSCANCHKSGVAGAPKLGDAVAWSTRTAKGIDVLYNSAKMGMPGTAMMAKGTCTVCSDAELNAAVDYMIAESK